MLGALAGGDALEIVVALRDLSAAGFKGVESNLKHLEGTANATNLSGFSKAAKGVEKDAEAAAGKGGGGIGGLASGLIGLAGGPVTLAIGALAALGATSIALTSEYDKVHASELQLAQAMKTHGESLDTLRPKVQAAIDDATQYGFGAMDVRDSITKMTEAGHSFADIQTELPHIMDLARAKNISLAEAARMYELALMGNSKAVKDLGIALPKLTDAAKQQQSAQSAVASASTALTTAQNQLKLTEDGLAGKHKLTALQADHLRMAHERVDAASAKLKAAQDKLTAANANQGTEASRATMLNNALTKAIGDQRTAVTPLQQAQARLGNIWETLASTAGPPLETMFGALISAIATLLDWVTKALGLLGKLGDALGHVAKAVADSPVGKFAGGVGGAIGNVAGAVGGAIGNAANFIGGLIPHFAAGGVVNRPTLAMIGEGGEREYVIPQSRLGALGGQTVVHAHLYLDGNEIAYAMERPLGALFALRGTSARLGSGA